ncbi:fimbrial protein [Serratia silvae]|uniref:Fimbrial protein n=1 Tax=Serratia silvae TaxID=2824122 RepID=A0ABT0KGZ8_9GAMM|nr:fimbrial protein [Serratia silvae]MCL1031290.1 fimbrial protein [Serratia silvae]
MRVRQKQCCYLFGILLGLPWVAEAKVEATSTVKVSVTVTAALPCKLNDNEPIVVDFTDVMTTQVNGENYRQKVNYTLSCSANSPNAIKLQFQGTSAWFDPKALQTNKMGLGIALLQGGKRLAINEWLAFTYPNLPVLEAVPVKAPNTTLDTGEFSTTATLKVAYQ